jgi:hypothetical protein
VADAACTFVMVRAAGEDGGGGLPVVLALLTKPEQPDRPMIAKLAAKTTRKTNGRYRTRHLLSASEHTHRVLVIRTSISGLKAASELELEGLLRSLLCLAPTS